MRKVYIFELKKESIEDIREERVAVVSQSLKEASETLETNGYDNFSPISEDGVNLMKVKKKNITPDIILGLISARSGISIETLKQQERGKRYITDVRKCYFKLAKELTKLSFSSIAFFIGGRDHATAIHGIKTFDNLYKDPSFKARIIYDSVKEQLERGDYTSPEEFSYIQGVINHYDATIYNMKKEHKTHVEKLTRKSEVWEDIQLLPTTDYQKAIVMMQGFLTATKAFNQNQKS